MNELTLLNRIFNLSESACMFDAKQLYALNDITSRRGLTLTREQAVEVAKTRSQALYENERVEIGVGATDKIIRTFSSSSYANARNWAEIVLEIVERFYFIKSEVHDAISDNELIDFMYHTFENVCGGALEMLVDETEELIRHLNAGGSVDIEAEIDLSLKIDTVFLLDSIAAPSERAAVYNKLSDCYFDIKKQIGGTMNDYAILGGMYQEYLSCGGTLDGQSAERVMKLLKGDPQE